MMKYLFTIILAALIGSDSPSVWAPYGIIDIHAHIGTFCGYDLSVENLLDNMKRYGVALALVSNIDGADLSGITRNLNERMQTMKRNGWCVCTRNFCVVSFGRARQMDLPFPTDFRNNAGGSEIRPYKPNCDLMLGDRIW
jgi:hypothetical protein